MQLVSSTNIRVALFQPRIPQNTGNIARTCAAFNYQLDLIGPLGFSLEDKYLKRAGLDYWDYVDVKFYESIDLYIKEVAPLRIIGFSKKATTPLSDLAINDNSIYLFGREDNGLPDYVQNLCHEIISIPMPGQADLDGSNGVRSLNLAVSVGIVSYQIYHQLCSK